PERIACTICSVKCPSCMAASLDESEDRMDRPPDARFRLQRHRLPELEILPADRADVNRRAGRVKSIGEGEEKLGGKMVREKRARFLFRPDLPERDVFSLARRVHQDDALIVRY